MEARLRQIAEKTYSESVMAPAGGFKEAFQREGHLPTYYKYVLNIVLERRTRSSAFQRDTIVYHFRLTGYLTEQSRALRHLLHAFYLVLVR